MPRKLTQQEFLERCNLEHPEYTYEKAKYVNADTKVIVTCPIHGDFLQSPNHHLAGKGCPQCNKLGTKSKGELQVAQALQNLGIAYEEQVSYQIPEWDHKVIIDFVVSIDNHKFFIEYNGKQHYVPIEHFGGELRYQFQTSRDQALRTYCLNNSIGLLELRYDIPFKNLENERMNFIRDELRI